MSRVVKVKSQPGEAVRFPKICTHCGQAAGERMRIGKRRGQTTRTIYVPVCAECGRELNLKSGEEERLGRIGLVAAVLAGLVVILIGGVVLPGLITIAALLPLWLRLIFSVALAVPVAVGVWQLFKRRSLREAKPIKLAVLNSARMTHYSWRATTFEFENDVFVERFNELNESNLMEV